MKKIQKNKLLQQDIIDKLIIKELLLYEAFYNLYLPTSIKDKILFIKFSKESTNEDILKKILADNETIRTNHGLLYFLNLLIKNTPIKENDNSEKYVNYTDREVGITLSKVSSKVLTSHLILIKNYLRFMTDSIFVYKTILTEYNNLPQKNNLNKALIEKELFEMFIDTDMSTSLQDSDTINKFAIESIKFIKEDSTFTIDKNVLINYAKEEHIEYKELKKIFPNRRSTYTLHFEFINFIFIYSYSFFINNFTYGYKSEASKFAHTSIEYIKALVNSEKSTIKTNEISEYTENSNKHYINTLKIYTDSNMSIEVPRIFSGKISNDNITLHFLERNTFSVERLIIT